MKSNLSDQIRAAQMAAHARRSAQEETASFKKFSASELFCPKCNRAMPVREKMLLVLPSGELYDYVCVQCGSSVGTRKA